MRKSLIILKIDNIEKIQPIRKKDDELVFTLLPHIIFENASNQMKKIELEETWEPIIDSVIVESIGENEEFILEFEIKLV